MNPRQSPTTCRRVSLEGREDAVLSLPIVEVLVNVRGVDGMCAELYSLNGNERSQYQKSLIKNRFQQRVKVKTLSLLTNNELCSLSGLLNPY
jgi:hypothetical protein